MNRPRALALGAAALVVVLGLVAVLVVWTRGDDKPPATYVLNGDPGGSKFEGISVDQKQDTFYVTEITGGEIHRGNTGQATTQEWKPEGADGRSTARGMATDGSDRVYVAGGP